MWRVGSATGEAIARPSIKVGERLQGFRSGWTNVGPKERLRWKMVGNAVSVPVAEWIGAGLAGPKDPVDVRRRSFVEGQRWPSAAASLGGARESWDLSERPLAKRAPQSLAALLGTYGLQPLSHGAANGFYTRLQASTLRVPQDFRAALAAHVQVSAG